MTARGPLLLTMALAASCSSPLDDAIRGVNVATAAIVPAAHAIDDAEARAEDACKALPTAEVGACFAAARAKYNAALEAYDGYRAAVAALDALVEAARSSGHEPDPGDYAAALEAALVAGRKFNAARAAMEAK